MYKDNHLLGNKVQSNPIGKSKFIGGTGEILLTLAGIFRNLHAEIWLQLTISR